MIFSSADMVFSSECLRDFCEVFASARGNSPVEMHRYETLGDNPVLGLMGIRRYKDGYPKVITAYYTAVTLSEIEEANGFLVVNDMRFVLCGEKIKLDDELTIEGQRFKVIQVAFNLATNCSRGVVRPAGGSDGPTRS